MKPILYKGLLILLLLLVLKPDVFSQAPSISYSPVTTALPIGLRMTISPTNTGGAIPATVYGTITTFAGSNTATSGFTDATGTAARFNLPAQAVADGSGNLYVADYSNNAIRKITSGGVVTTFAGSTSGTSGSTDGTGTAARFNHPDGIAIDGSGNLFVSDHSNNSIRKVTSGAVVTTFYTGGSTFGPAGLCFDGSGNLIVAAQGLSQIIKITTGAVASTIAGNYYGYANGTGTAALFKNPTGVAMDASGNIYVADYLNNAIRKITTSAVVTTFAGSSVAGNTGGFLDGVGTAAKFNNPTGLWLTSGGVIYVADYVNYNIRRILPDGTVNLVIGSPTQTTGTADGVGTAATLSHPDNFYVDPSGTGWDVDQYASIRKVVLTGYTISGGTLPAGLSFDSTTGTISGTPTTATASQTFTVMGFNNSGYSSTTITLSVLAAPSIAYSPSTNNLTVGTLFSISPANSGGAIPATVYSTITTFAGSNTATSGFTDATGTAARFNLPAQVVADGFGNLFVADYTNNAIRKITSAGVVTTFAGSTSGTSGSTDGTGTAARFNHPDGIAIDASGNLYVSDHSNNLIRKITPGAVVTTFYTGSGSFGPAGLCFDGSGNLIVAAQGLSQIIKITPASVASTIAGNYYGYANGTGTAALFKNPTGVAMDASGNIYVADYLNNAIRKITTSAVVTTFAGSSVAGNTGGFLDGVGTAAKFNNPTGLWLTSGGVIYVADYVNYNLRRVLTDATVKLVVGSPTQTTGTADGVGTAATLSHPDNFYVDPTGTGWDVDQYASIRKVILTGYTISGTLPAGLSFDPTTGTISGTPSAVFSSQTFTVMGYNASGYSATTITLSASAIAAPAIRYIPSTNNLKVGQAFSVTPTNSAGTVPAATYGQVTTFAGSTSGTSGFTDATGTAARFHTPYAAVMDAFGNLFVADKANNAIREITTSGVVTTFAGSTSGTSGSTNGTGTAARFNGPDGIAIDGSGNLFVADFNNNSIRKITAAAVVTTFASSLNGPVGLSFDGSGNLIVASQGGNKILKITSSGTVSTIAGNTAGYVNATGTSALFKSPTGVQTDVLGNIYVADYLNNAIRKITSSAAVTTYAGSTVSGNTGSFLDGRGTSARFNNPTGIVSAAGGLFYVSDYLNNDLRRIMPDTTVTLIAGSASQASGTTDGTGTAARFNNPVSLYIDGTGNGYVVDANNNNIRKITLTGFTISGGTLPTGLSFDPTTGIISGTPTTVTPSQTFVVTAFNRGGFSVTSVDISVSQAADLGFDWTGALSADWSAAGNWSSGVVPGSSDNARIGVVTFNHQPAVSANVQVGSILFGDIKTDSLTVNSGNTLTVNGTITQSHSAGDLLPSVLLLGSGTLNCHAITVGNNVLPKVVGIKTTLFTSRVSTLSVTDSLVILSATTDLLSGGLANNNAVFSLEGGQLSVGKHIKLDNNVPAYFDTIPGEKPVAKFQISITSSLNATLANADSSLFIIRHPGLDSIDFYKHVSGTGIATVSYQGGDQLFYTNNSAAVDTLPYTYQNITVSGTGTKTAGKTTAGNRFTVGGILTISSSTLNLRTYKAFATVYGNFINRGSIALGKAGVRFNANFFNSGHFNDTTSTVYFGGGTQSLRDSTATGTNLDWVSFAHTGTKTIQSGTFAVIPAGRLMMADTATLSIDTAARLILRSDSTGTASVTPVPANCLITGNVNAEWFVQGSWTNISGRGYRQLSSPVNHTGNTNGTGDYNINWIKGTTLYNGAIMTGPAGNGFEYTGNPTLYIFREDINTGSGSFTNGNYKGINKINNTDPNDIGTQARFTTTPVADTTIRLHIGNGVLFFFRGNRVLNNGTTSGTKTTLPYNYPESVTFTNTGSVNQGQVQLKLFYRSNNYLSYTKSTAIANDSVRGHNFVGNPYPSRINLDNFSATDSTASIYGPGLINRIFILNATHNGYDYYIPDPSHDRNQIYSGTGIATNIIQSGQAFYIHVDSTSASKNTATLRFREGAKFNPPDTIHTVMTLLFARHALLSVPTANGRILAKTTPVTRILPAASRQPQQLQVSLETGTKTRGMTTVLMDGKWVKTPVNLTLGISQKPGSPLIQPGHALQSTGQVRLATGNLPTGAYVIRISGLQQLSPVYKIQLKDKLSGKTLDVRRQARYTFIVNKMNRKTYGDRFELLVTRLGK